MSAAMPPATTAGFQYTPPSYLVRASDTTNRPWSKTDETEGGNNHEYQYTGENEYDIAQEFRPNTRQSHLNAHFQQRVRNKTSRYRDILSGEAELPENSQHESTNTEDNDSVLEVAKNADCFADIHSAKLNVQQASSNKQARKNRKDRITGNPEPRRSSTASEAENARSLRAHRLRATLLKHSADDFDAQTKLEMRRIARRDEEAAARKAERDALENDPTFTNDTISHKKDIEQKRLQEEAEREVMALAKEEAAVALLRAAELNEERIRQRDRELRREEYRQREKGHKKRGSRGSSRKKKHSSLRTKDYNPNDTDGDTFMTEFDAENDFAFLNDLSGIVRDSGLLKTCGGCFGELSDSCAKDGEDNSKDSQESFLATAKSKSSAACAAISSVFVPDLVPSSDTSASDNSDELNKKFAEDESIRRSRMYARYRE